MSAEEDIIKADQLQVTKTWTWAAGGIGVALPAIYTAFKELSKDGDPTSKLLTAVAAVMVASIVAISFMVAADLRARATVTAAKETKEATIQAAKEARAGALSEEWTENVQSALQSLLSPSEALDKLVGAVKLGRAQLAPLGALVGASVKGEGNQKFLLLAVLRDTDKEKTEYLVTRIGGKLEWRSEGDITEIHLPSKTTK